MLLAAAKVSPEEGTLLIAPGIPHTDKSLEKVCLILPKERRKFTTTLLKLCRMSVLNRREDNAYYFANWNKRQYLKPSQEPEAIRERVHKHRATKSANVTPLKRECNANVTRLTETEAETDTYTETKQQQTKTEMIPGEPKKVLFETFPQFSKVNFKPKTAEEFAAALAVLGINISAPVIRDHEREVRKQLAWLPYRRINKNLQAFFYMAVKKGYEEPAYEVEKPPPKYEPFPWEGQPATPADKALANLKEIKDSFKSPLEVPT